MKNFQIVAYSLVLILTLGTFSMAADLKDGFMGYKWGEDISRYPELKEVRAKGDIGYYHNPDEQYSIDNISIKDALFGFYQDGLFAVYIGIDSLETYDQILMHMKRKYGFPDTKTSARQYLSTYKWKYNDVTIKLKTDEIGGKMKLAFYYRPVSRELNAGQLDLSDDSSVEFFPVDKNKQPRMVPFLTF